jgi:CheY-like chemotaxis protein
MPDDAPPDDRPVVLVVDDHRESRLIAEKVLGPDYQVVTASSGREGLDYAASHPVDIVLLDIQMPGLLNGVDVLRELRGLPDFEAPVVAFTAYVMPQHRELYAREGFDALIKKPYTLDDLRETVRSLLPAP